MKLTASDIIDYPKLLAAAADVGLECVYPNGAAFAPKQPWHVAGWVTSDDTSLRPAFRDKVVRRQPEDLPQLTATASFEVLRAQEVWLAPVHHWAAELDHGDDAAGGSTRDLFPPELAGRTQADGLRLTAADQLHSVLAALLPRLWKTDFTLLLPSVPVVITLHHHRQIWFRCEAEAMTQRLQELQISRVG